MKAGEDTAIRVRSHYQREFAPGQLVVGAGERADHLFVIQSGEIELSREGPRQGLLQRFDSSGRIALGAISYIHVESRLRSLRVRAFHTFPDDYAIVQTRSLFEIP